MNINIKTRFRTKFNYHFKVLVSFRRNVKAAVRCHCYVVALPVSKRSSYSLFIRNLEQLCHKCGSTVVELKFDDLSLFCRIP